MSDYDNGAWHHVRHEHKEHTMGNSRWDYQNQGVSAIRRAAGLGDLTDEAIERLIDETSATERLAEHTGDRTFVIADEIAAALNKSINLRQRLTSGDRLNIADILRKHGV